VSTQKKSRRKLTAAAVIVGSICFLFSFCLIFGIFIFALLYLKQYINNTILLIIFGIATLPLVVAIMWLTVFLMESIEKLFGIRFRTKSGLQEDE